MSVPNRLLSYDCRGQSEVALPLTLCACLHAPQTGINSVKVGPASCNFVLNTPLASAIAAGSSTQNIRSAYPEFKRKLYQAVNEGEEGELAITLPPDTVKRANQRTTAGSLAPGADGKRVSNTQGVYSVCHCAQTIRRVCT